MSKLFSTSLIFSCAVFLPASVSALGLQSAKVTNLPADQKPSYESTEYDTDFKDTPWNAYWNPDRRQRMYDEFPDEYTSSACECTSSKNGLMTYGDLLDGACCNMNDTGCCQTHAESGCCSSCGCVPYHSAANVILNAPIPAWLQTRPGYYAWPTWGFGPKSCWSCCGVAGAIIGGLACVGGSVIGILLGTNNGKFPGCCAKYDEDGNSLGCCSKCNPVVGESADPYMGASANSWWR